MRSLSRKTSIALFVVVLLAVGLACGTSNGDTGGGETGDQPDLEATQRSIEATQAALEAEKEQAEQPPAEEKPVEEPVEEEQPEEEQMEPQVVADPCAPVDGSGYLSGDVILGTDFASDECWVYFAVPDAEYGEEYDVYPRDGSFLYFEVRTSGVTAYAVYDPLFMERGQADVRVDAFVENLGGPNTNNISLICRGSDRGWYEASITSGGEWFLWKYTPEEGYELLGSGGSVSINNRLSTNELTLTCIGDRLTFYANGVELVDWRDNALRDGQVGLSVTSFLENWNYQTNPVEVEVDWFTISIP